MLPISFARRVTAPRCLCSTSPFNANARRSSAAPSPVLSLLRHALASLCTCFFAPRFSAPLHVLWPLIPRSAGQPQPCQCLSSLRHRHALPFFSIAEHSLSDAKQICSAAYRVTSHLRHSKSKLRPCKSGRFGAVPLRVCSIHIDAIPRPFASLPCRSRAGHVLAVAYAP